MGKVATVNAVFSDGPDEGRLQYEPPRLVFKGRERRVYEGAALEGVTVAGEDLVLADGARFALGEKRAKLWLDAIVNPKDRMEKIGVKPGMQAAIMGVADPELSQELAAKGAVPVRELADLDLLFYAADDAEALAMIEALVPMLKPAGALWVVSRKGKAATLKDTEVMEAARARGLVDTKVVAFSETLTALRFVRRKDETAPAAI